MTKSWDAPLFFGEFGANNDPNPDIQDFQVRLQRLKLSPTRKAADVCLMTCLAFRRHKALSVAMSGYYMGTCSDKMVTRRPGNRLPGLSKGVHPAWQAPNYINMFYDTLDAHLLGGTQWGWTDDFHPATKDGWNVENFSIVDHRRNLRSNFAVRPYPRAIAGVPSLFKVMVVPPDRGLSPGTPDGGIPAARNIFRDGRKGAASACRSACRGCFTCDELGSCTAGGHRQEEHGAVLASDSRHPGIRSRQRRQGSNDRGVCPRTGVLHSCYTRGARHPGLLPTSCCPPHAWQYSGMGHVQADMGCLLRRRVLRQGWHAATLQTRCQSIATPAK